MKKNIVLLGILSSIATTTSFHAVHLRQGQTSYMISVPRSFQWPGVGGETVTNFAVIRNASGMPLNITVYQGSTSMFGRLSNAAHKNTTSNAVINVRSSVDMNATPVSFIENVALNNLDMQYVPLSEDSYLTSVEIAPLVFNGEDVEAKKLLLNFNPQKDFFGQNHLVFEITPTFDIVQKIAMVGAVSK